MNEFHDFDSREIFTSCLLSYFYSLSWYSLLTTMKLSVIRELSILLGVRLSDGWSPAPVSS